MKALKLSEVPWKDPIDETDNHYVFYDGFPVAPGHMLFVPKIDTPLLITYCLTAAWERGNQLIQMGCIDGFNIGMNNLPAAGQTVGWPHIHLIPRMAADTLDPIGGVRNVIPGQGNYHKDTYVKPSMESWEFIQSVTNVTDGNIG